MTQSNFSPRRFTDTLLIVLTVTVLFVGLRLTDRTPPTVLAAAADEPTGLIKGARISLPGEAVGTVEIYQIQEIRGNWLRVAAAADWARGQGDVWLNVDAIDKLAIGR